LDSYACSVHATFEMWMITKVDIKDSLGLVMLILLNWSCRLEITYVRIYVYELSVRVMVQVLYRFDL